MRVIAVVLVASLLAGCLGTAEGPGIPQDALAPKGWGRAGEPSSRTLYGLAEIRQQEYGPGGQGQFGGALVVSVTDVPILDEAKYVPDQMRAYEQAKGLRFEPAGTETLSLANMGGTEVAAQVYDVEGAVPAKAVVVQVRCEDPRAFVVGVGYGALPASGGVLGGTTADVYAEARDLLEALACRV